MIRGDITTVSELKAGDRFYKFGNAAKTPLQFIEQESHGKYKVCEAKVTQNGFLANKNLAKIYKGITKVVFLRNVNESDENGK